MFQDSVPISLAVISNAYSFSNDEKKRREGAIRNKDYFYGRQEQYLQLLNEDVDPIAVNLTNPIVSKRASLLYTHPLVREFDGPAGSVSTLEKIYYDLKIDDVLHQVDLSAELTGTCLVFVGQDEEGNIFLTPYDAADFSVVSENNILIDALQLITITDLVENDSVKMPVPALSVRRVIDSEVWTNDYIYKIRDGVQDPNPEVNELEFVPFAQFKAQEVINQYLGHSPAISIRQLNASYNQMVTNLGYMIKMQSATPIVLNGFSQGEAMSVHPGTAISLPVGAQAGALQLNPKIMDTLEAVKYLEDKIYETSSVPKITVLGDSSGSTSGVELLIKWAPITSVFTEKANRYQQYELHLANMILDVLGEENIVDVKVKYREDYLPVDPDRDRLPEDITLGIRTPVDEVLKLNQNLDEVTAEAEVLANLEFNGRLTNKPTEA